MRNCLPVGLLVFIGIGLPALTMGAAQASESTEGESADVGFQPLFQQDSLANWDRVGNAQFSVNDGSLICDGSGDYSTWIRTRDTFENFVLRFQYRMKPHGDGGVFLHAPLHGRASAVGILVKLSDDTTRSRPTFTSTGGIFGAQPPNCLSGLVDQWVNVEIRCDFPQLAVTVNGQLVQDVDMRDDPMLRYRPRAGFLGFQDCSRPVEYRHVRVKRLPGTEKEWRPLFHGNDLTGWKQIDGGASWRVENEVLTADGGSGYLATEKEYHNFEWRAYVQTMTGSNGGIFLRFKSLPSDRGFEIQIEDNPSSNNPTGSIYNHRRACCTPMQAGTWYPLQILVRGRHGTIRVNGVTVAQTDSLPVDRAGHIAIQCHHQGSRIRIKKMKIQVLD
jgi:hypothetical protein